MNKVLNTMSRNYKVLLILFCIITILVVAVIYSVSWLRRYQLFGEYARKIDTDKKAIALTFDDGPNPPITDEILDILAKYRTKATFFVLGKRAEDHIDMLKKIYAGGHEIGNHSWSHERLQFRSPAFVKREVFNTDRIIRASGYKGPIHFRSPFGSRFIVLPFLLMRSHRVHILWNITLNDWESPTPEKILQNFEKAMTPGSIVLLHDGYPKGWENRKNTAKALELILKEYSNKGYQFVTISELLKMGKPRAGIVF